VLAHAARGVPDGSGNEDQPEKTAFGAYGGSWLHPSPFGSLNALCEDRHAANLRPPSNRRLTEPRPG